MRVHLWGKEGCSKCAALHRRLENVQKLKPFELIYHDIKTVEGLVAFCRHGSINGNNIPAVTVEGDLPPLERKGFEGTGCLPLYGEYGICTDYDHGGVIKPETVQWFIYKAAEMLE